MPRVTLEQIGSMLRETRGSRTLREVASEIGVSHATLSRIERGKLPDLETFPKICRWLGLDASEVLGLGGGIEAKKGVATSRVPPSVHLRAKRNLSPSLSRALASLIQAAQEMQADEEQ